MIDKRSVLEIVCKTKEAGSSVLDDCNHFADVSPTLDRLTSTSGKVSAAVKTGFDGSNNGNENSIAGRRITQGASAILSVWSSVMIQDWRVKTWAKIFETAKTPWTSWKEHAKSGRDDDGCVNNFIPRAEQIYDTNISRVRESYFTKRQPSRLNQVVARINDVTILDENCSRLAQ